MCEGLNSNGRTSKPKPLDVSIGSCIVEITLQHQRWTPTRSREMQGINTRVILTAKQHKQKRTFVCIWNPTDWLDSSTNPHTAPNDTETVRARHCFSSLVLITHVQVPTCRLQVQTAVDRNQQYMCGTSRWLKILGQYASTYRPKTFFTACCS